VAGVDDEALNLRVTGSGSVLYVRKGNRGCLPTVSGPNIDSASDQGLAKEEHLAALILPRLSPRCAHLPTPKQRKPNQPKENP
jgi:hypothetical protein